MAKIIETFVTSIQQQQQRQSSIYDIVFRLDKVNPLTCLQPIMKLKTTKGSGSGQIVCLMVNNYFSASM